MGAQVLKLLSQQAKTLKVGYGRVHSSIYIITSFRFAFCKKAMKKGLQLYEVYASRFMVMWS